MNYIESCWITACLLTRDAFNVSHKRVGGIRFVKLGRINLTLSVSQA